MSKQPNYDSLSPQRQMFVDAYVTCGNATKAAIEAKYSPRGAGTTGHRLLHDVKVSAAIAERREAVQARAEVTVDAVVKEIARIGFSDIRGVLSDEGGLLPPSEWSDAVAASIKSIKVKELYENQGDGMEPVGTLTEVRLWDKGAAHERLMKHLGGYEADNRQRTLDGVSDEALAKIAALLGA